MTATEESEHQDIIEKITTFMHRAEGRRIMIQTHDVPDPDAIAAAETVRLIARTFGLTSWIVMNGLPNRRENRVMIRECRITLHPLESVKIKNPDRYAWVFVDCMPGGGNVTLHREAPGKLFLAIDHHKTHIKPSYRKRGVIISHPNAGSTSTIVGRALMDMDVPFPPRVAAALSYAIITDTMDFSRGATSEDLALFTELTPRTNQRLVSRLRNVSQPRRYFRQLHASLTAARFYRQVAWVFLGPVDGGEFVAEMADFILSSERITWALALGHADGRMFLSLRSTNRKAHCETVIHKIASGLPGAVGGHDQFAGGFLAIGREQDPEDVAREAVERFTRIILRIPRAEPVPEGTPLIEE